MKINEDVTKSDVEKIIKTYINSADFKSKIEKIVKQRIQDDSALENKVVEISKNVITQLYKTLWVKRGFWINNLGNKSN